MYLCLHVFVFLNQDYLHRGEWWIGWIREVSGVTCQEGTREELLDTLKIALCEVLEYDESQEAVPQDECEYKEVKIAV